MNMFLYKTANLVFDIPVQTHTHTHKSLTVQISGWRGQHEGELHDHQRIVSSSVKVWKSTDRLIGCSWCGSILIIQRCATHRSQPVDFGEPSTRSLRSLCLVHGSKVQLFLRSRKVCCLIIFSPEIYPIFLLFAHQLCLFGVTSLTAGLGLSWLS